MVGMYQLFVYIEINKKVPLVTMFLTEHITRGVVHINNTLKLLDFEDLDIKELKIDESETEKHEIDALKHYYYLPNHTIFHHIHHQFHYYQHTTMGCNHHIEYLIAMNEHLQLLIY